MEQHPVPRNISGFQFHLIGDMTLRQFAFLAVGGFLGYLIYKGAPFEAIINIPLALFFVFAGFAFAFLPVQERPLDKWIGAFIKSIMSPTQFVWFKKNLPPEILTTTISVHFQVVQPASQTQAHKDTNEKLRVYLATIPIPLHESLNAAEKRYIDKTLSLFSTHSTPGLPNATQPIQARASNEPVPMANIQPIPPSVNLPVQPNEFETSSQIRPPVQDAEKSLILKSKPEEKEQASPAPAVDNNINLQNQLSQLAAEKIALEKELQKLQQQFSGLNTQKTVTPEAPLPENKEPVIKVANVKPAASDIGMLNFQQAPNLIAGVIKDPQRKLLPNIILTIKDKSGLPVRALKTNKLGQFTTATPLPNGTYLLEIEDPMKRYVFDVTQISLSGKIFLPIELIARGEKELMREKLSKELFGSQVM